MHAWNILMFYMSTYRSDLMNDSQFTYSRSMYSCKSRTWFGVWVHLPIVTFLPYRPVAINATAASTDADDVIASAPAARRHCAGADESAAADDDRCSIGVALWRQPAEGRAGNPQICKCSGRHAGQPVLPVISKCCIHGGKFGALRLHVNIMQFNRPYV